jgi:hypothetical protein
MRGRCYDPKNKAFKDYGGRGITVCAAWRGDYSRFLADVGRRPSPRHSIGRILNGGNYEPGNVQWETPVEQNSNRRSNNIIEIDGERLTLAEWSRRSGVHRATVGNRLRSGWTPRRAIFAPAGARRDAA